MTVLYYKIKIGKISSLVNLPQLRLEIRIAKLSWKLHSLSYGKPKLLYKRTQFSLPHEYGKISSAEKKYCYNNIIYEYIVVVGVRVYVK